MCVRVHIILCARACLRMHCVRVCVRACMREDLCDSMYSQFSSPPLEHKEPQCMYTCGISVGVVPCVVSTLLVKFGTYNMSCPLFS